jgi:ABC-2 type transport system permease protein
MQSFLQRYSYSVILLKQLVKTEFKLRYQGSVLGYLWSLLKPLLLFLILYIVFAEFLRVGESIPHFPVYLLIGVVLWNYFIEITTGSIAAIVGKGDLIRKLNFPKYIIVLSGCASAFINLLLNGIVIALFMTITGVDTGIRAILVIPLIIELTVLALGIGFLLSALYVKYRDIVYIWEVITQAAFYATPILYPIALVAERSDAAAKLLMLNPIAQVIQDIRYVLVTPETKVLSDFYSNNIVWLVPIAIVGAIIIFSSLYFRKRSRYFAEEV